MYSASFPGQRPLYRAIVIRWWPERGLEPREHPVWRFTLEHVGEERANRGFASLEALLAFLAAEIAEGDCQDVEPT